MAAPTTVTYGGITFTGPEISTANTNYFCLSITDSGRPQLYERWHYLGTDGMKGKPIGRGLRAGKLFGWIEGSTDANLKTAEAAIDALVAGHTPATMVITAGPTISDAVLVNAAYPMSWKNGTRFCRSFEIDWESGNG